MFVFLVSAVFLFHLTSAGVVSPISQGEERIYGGGIIDIREAPWTASVHAVNPSSIDFHCAGCIISQIFVATSAVCYITVNTNDFMVRVGSSYHGSGGQFINVTEFIYRPDSDVLDNNVGLLRLAQGIVLSSSAYPIALPHANDPIPYGKQATITGWGYFDSTNTESVELRKVVTPIWVDEEECHLHSPGFSNNTFCAGGVGVLGPCTKDSGAPLIVDDVLVGITIYPWTCYKDTTSVFIKVVSQIEWIESIIIGA